MVWAEDALREQFLAEGAAALAQAERDLIASWGQRVNGTFTILRHLKKHTIFMAERVYGVLGIYSPLAEMCPHVPMFVDAVLLPFRDVIITDGLIQSPGVRLSFGGSARRMFEADYKDKQAKSGLVTTLGRVAPAQPAQLEFSVGAWPGRSPDAVKPSLLPPPTPKLANRKPKKSSPRRAGR
ncbi:MAG: hypothetical protein ABIY55_25845 [Kofleriaceae bacterium]